MPNNIILSSFDDFRNESRLWKLINEAKLVASQDFLNRLKSMSSNQVAQNLYKAFSDNQLIDKNLNYNWIDVTEQEGMITFTSDRNAERFNNDPSQIWTSKRQQYSVGKLARAILPDIGYKISDDKEIEEFVNLYKASKQDDTKKFDVVFGPTIKHYYKADSYAQDSGTLGKSCMRYEKCQNYFKIYSKNSEVCKLLVYTDENNKVLGRALVWKLAKTQLFQNLDEAYEGNIEFFMDRVYTTNESDVLKFLDYAKKNNWLTKYKMSASNEESLQFLHNGKWVFGRIFVKLPRLHFDEYPYVDTLKFSDGDSLLSNVGFFVDMNEPDYDLGFVLNNTDGRATLCPNCDGTGHEQKQDGKCKKCKGKKELSCDKCGGSNFIMCNDCGGRGKQECDRCYANGIIACGDCGGDGTIHCSKCDGRGLAQCQICSGNGSLGDCEECTNGKKICNVCNNEPYNCEACNGEGKLIEDDEEHVCRKCAGKGKATEGSRTINGCRCPECSIELRSGRWRNQGSFDCDKCEGTGTLVCPMNCDNGYVGCDVCFGKGSFVCQKCKKKGLIKCPKCEGNKYLGPCPTCSGVGNLGSCSCENGVVPCQDCAATGVRGKIKEGEYKCHECAGLLDDFIVKKYPQARVN